jgi:uncharacterized protein (DUF983 family)
LEKAGIVRPPLGGVLANALRCRCPRCHEGPLFRAWPNKVLPRCPSCGLSYFREPGYYVGGMVITYGVAMVVLVAISLLLFARPDTGWLSENAKFGLWVACGILLTLGLLRHSYSLWISLDYWIEPWE